MAKIRIVGDSSGYVELAAPNAAGNNTLELPSNATKLVGADASNSLNVTGIATFSSGIVVSAGTTAAPSISPTGDSNTGIFFPSADTIAFAEGGVEALRVDSSGNVAIGTVFNLGKLSIQASSNTSLSVRDSTPVTGSSGILLENWANTTAPVNGTIPFAVRASQFQFGTDSGGNFTERLRIDSSGRVTMPYQPAFFATSNSGTITVSVGNYFPFNVLNTTFAGSSRNSGYNTSTYLYTAPVTGLYQFYVQFYLNPSSVQNSITWWKNGSQLSYEDAAINVYMNTNSSTTPSNIILNGAVILELSANDTVGIKPRTGNPNGINLYMNHSSFWGYLVG
jgi:hypothetical protein